MRFSKCVFSCVDCPYYVPDVCNTVGFHCDREFVEILTKFELLSALDTWKLEICLLYEVKQVLQAWLCIYHL